MTTMLYKAKKRAWALPLLLAGALLALAPARALAQGSAQGSAQIALYEVIESPPPRPSTSGSVGAFIPSPLDGILTRLAQATLTGPVLWAVDSLGTWVGGEVDAHAQSRVDLTTTGVGPISGVFTVDLANGGAVSAKLNGVLDLSSLLAGTAPLAWVAGSWNTLGKSSAGGTFTGVAQVPIDCGVLGGGGASGTFCYLTDSGAVPLSPNEFNRKGMPLVRFILLLSAL